MTSDAKTLIRRAKGITGRHATGLKCFVFKAYPRTHAASFPKASDFAYVCKWRICG